MPVFAVPIDTPAGGLVRVQDMAGTTFFDSSYTRGTAACSLETKLRWKVTKEGPPPFKTGTPPVAFPEMLAGMCSGLAAVGVSVSIDEAAVAAAMEAGPKDAAKATAMEKAVSALSEEAELIKESTEAEDTKMVEEVQAQVTASLSASG